MEKNPDFILVKIDYRNTINEMSRTCIIAMFAGVILSPTSGLESKGKIWGWAEDGTTQGDPVSSPFFCIGLQL